MADVVFVLLTLAGFGLLALCAKAAETVNPRNARTNAPRFRGDPG